VLVLVLVLPKLITIEGVVNTTSAGRKYCHASGDSGGVTLKHAAPSENAHSFFLYFANLSNIKD